VLFNEPKLLKSVARIDVQTTFVVSFSALQRAEIAEIRDVIRMMKYYSSFSALQRAEIAEIYRCPETIARNDRFQCSSTSRNC